MQLQKKGFTLVEVLVVVAIIGILIIISESLIWVAVAIISLLLVWLLDTIENRAK